MAASNIGLYSDFGIRFGILEVDIFFGITRNYKHYPEQLETRKVSRTKILNNSELQTLIGTNSTRLQQQKYPEQLGIANITMNNLDVQK